MKPKEDREASMDANMERVSTQELLRNWTSSINAHIQFCGHQVHIECFDRYFSALLRSNINDQEYEGEVSRFVPQLY